jgi:hypothetical protein
VAGEFASGDGDLVGRIVYLAEKFAHPSLNGSPRGRALGESLLIGTRIARSRATADRSPDSVWANSVTVTGCTRFSSAMVPDLPKRGRACQWMLARGGL